MPFGNLLVPYLDIFKITAEKLSSKDSIAIESFSINPDRLRKQTIYFTVTAQIVNLALEVVVPYVKRRVFKEVEKVQSKIAAKDANGKATITDAPEEHAFLERVRNEAQLAVYDVTTDYREMVVQFGKFPLGSLLNTEPNI